MGHEAIAEASDDDGQPMDPNVWGPPLWDFLFCMCFKSPDTCALDMQHLFILLESVMPCSHCRRSYALYRKQIRPVASIRADRPDSSARWLWTIHDMVNQKLGKICISYDKLSKRHAGTTMITNDMTVLDILCIIALSVKRSQRDKAVCFVQTTLRVLRETSPVFVLPDVAEDCQVASETTLLEDLWRLSNSLRSRYRLPEQDMPTFLAQYQKCYA